MSQGNYGVFLKDADIVGHKLAGTSKDMNYELWTVSEMEIVNKEKYQKIVPKLCQHHRRHCLSSKCNLLIYAP